MKMNITDILRSLGVVLSKYNRPPGLKPLPAATLTEMFKADVEQQRRKQTRPRIDDSWLR